MLILNADVDLECGRTTTARFFACSEMERLQQSPESCPDMVESIIWKPLTHNMVLSRNTAYGADSVAHGHRAWKVRIDKGEIMFIGVVRTLKTDEGNFFAVWKNVGYCYFVEAHSCVCDAPPARDRRLRLDRARTTSP